MLQFILYCDLPTMKCTASDINAELSSFADFHMQVNDTLWLFKYPEGFVEDSRPKEEHLFCDHFEKFTDENSVIFLAPLDGNHYYILPDAAHRFLSAD